MARITDKIFSKADEAVTALSKEEKVAILEIAYLAVAADRQINENEVVALRRIAKTLDGAAGALQSEQAIDGFITHGSLDRDHADARLRLLAKALSSPAKRVAYKAAYALASSDDESSDEEFEFDLQLIDALGLEQSEVDGLVAELS